MPRRFQFSLRSLLVAMLAICCFLGGMVVQKQLDEPEWISKGHPASEMSTDEAALQIIRLPDGTKWQRNIWGTREDRGSAHREEAAADAVSTKGKWDRFQLRAPQFPSRRCSG